MHSQYGAVYKAKEKRTQRQFALKKVATLNDEAARRDIEFEASAIVIRLSTILVSPIVKSDTLFKCAKSPHVVGFFGSWLNSTNGDFWV